MLLISLCLSSASTGTVTEVFSGEKKTTIYFSPVQMKMGVQLVCPVTISFVETGELNILYCPPVSRVRNQMPPCTRL